MHRIILAAVAGIFTLSQAVTFTQGGRAPQLATDIKAADIQAVLKSPNGGVDRQVRVVDVGKYNMAVGILHRDKTKPGAPTAAINHEQVTEVYYIVSGSGTLLTGGTVSNARPLPPENEIVKILVGPSNTGVFAAPAQSRKVDVGDVVIIPAGVYHGFTDIADHVDYLSVRPDTDHLLPAGYLNPVLKP